MSAIPRFFFLLPKDGMFYLLALSLRVPGVVHCVPFFLTVASFFPKFFSWIPGEVTSPLAEFCQSFLPGLGFVQLFRQVLSLFSQLPRSFLFAWYFSVVCSSFPEFLYFIQYRRSTSSYFVEKGSQFPLRRLSAARQILSSEAALFDPSLPLFLRTPL